MHGSDNQHYGALLQDYENSFIEGVDRFSKTLTDAYNLLVKYKQDKRYMNTERISDGANFLNQGEEEDEEKGTALAQRNFDKSKMSCHHCNELGHFENECPKKKKKEGSGTNLLMKADFSSSPYMFCQREKREPASEINDDSSDDEDSNNENDPFENGSYATTQPDTSNGIPPTWFILNNGSTVDVFNNKGLLSDVNESNTKMYIHCNAGVSTTYLEGHVRGYGKVWYAPDGIANILSLFNMTKNSGLHTIVRMMMVLLFTNLTETSNFSSILPMDYIIWTQLRIKMIQLF